MIVDNILRRLTSRLHHLVVAIEESKNIVEMKFGELQGSLEGHEHRLGEREAEKN